MMYSMHASKSTYVLLSRVTVLVFSILGTNVRSIERKRVPWASALRSKNSAQERIYPDIAQVSGIFWQKSSPAIDHWNGVRE